MQVALWDSLAHCADGSRGEMNGQKGCVLSCLVFALLALLVVVPHVLVVGRDNR